MNLYDYLHIHVVSVTGKSGIGIPIILLHDSEGAVVTIELKNGTVYRGILQDSQDNMNCTIKNCSKRDPDGKESILEMAYIRGSSVKFIILPDILSKAPYFNRIKMWRKFKGHAVFGVNTVVAPRGQSISVRGRGGGGGGPRSMGNMNGNPRFPGPGMPVGPPGAYPRAPLPLPLPMSVPMSMPMARPGLGYPPSGPNMGYLPPSGGYRGRS